MNNETRFMKTPYKSLKSKMNNKSEPYLMISELLDNSIGSWENEKKEGYKITNDLEIVLEIDLLNRRIICTDNANGMNAEELLDSVELNKETPGNNMHMFGVGMKNAAFWFGEDLIIESNDGKMENSTSVKLSKISDLTKPVEWGIETPKIKIGHQGTRVTIENVYLDRVLNEDEIDELLRISKIKYKQYILGEINSKYRVNITFKILDKSGSMTEKILKPHNRIAQIIPEGDVKNFIVNLNRKFKHKELILLGLKDEAIEKATNGEPLTFENTLGFDGKKIIFKYGVTRQSGLADGRDNKFFKPFYGITAYQNGRGIRISGVNPMDFPKVNYTRSDIKRIHASFELGHIFSPDNNKSNFNFGVLRQEFQSLLANIGKDLKLLAESVALTIGKNAEAKPGTSKSSRKKIKEGLEAKSTKFVWQNFDVFDTEMSFVDTNNKEWKVTLSEVSIDNINAKDYFINAAIDVNDEEIKISYNVNHPIWKPLVNQTNAIDLKTVTYPLITILGLSKVGIENNLISKWVGKETSDYLDSISQLAKFGLKL